MTTSQQSPNIFLLILNLHFLRFSNNSSQHLFIKLNKSSSNMQQELSEAHFLLVFVIKLNVSVLFFCLISSVENIAHQKYIENVMQLVDDWLMTVYSWDCVSHVCCSSVLSSHLTVISHFFYSQLMLDNF